MPQDGELEYKQLLAFTAEGFDAKTMSVNELLKKGGLREITAHAIATNEAVSIGISFIAEAKVVFVGFGLACWEALFVAQGATVIATDLGPRWNSVCERSPV
jgi:hypothetical protein